MEWGSGLRAVPALLCCALGRAPSNGAAPAGPPEIHVTHYRLTLRVDPDAKSLAGEVAMRASAGRDGVADLALDLADALTVDSVLVDGLTVPFTRPTNRVAVVLPRPVRRGAPIALTIAYHGHPVGPGFSFDTRDGVPRIASFGLPYGAKDWWPCRDTPADKADSADVIVTVPRPLVVASNGLLIGETANGDASRTFHWRVRYPIYPDVLSLAIADYTTFTSYYRGGRGDSLPLTFYVFPRDVERAERDFAVLPELLRSHVAYFGDYPFWREKYGVAEVAVHSYREHQTLPSYGEYLVTGDHRNDRVLAHELAHQWFGNLVSVRNWSHVWLNEGFATYAYALWQERRGGATAYRAAMAQADRDDFTGSIYISDSTDVAAMFTSTTFGKASWVLHMLRHVMGDAAFFGALRDYLRAYAYRDATTQDFQRMCERRYGHGLAWFFREWIYGVSRPTYAVAWTPSSDGVRLTLRQLQADAGPFTMPIDVRVRAADRSTQYVIWDSLPVQDFALPVRGRPVAVAIDEGGWILKRLAPAFEDLPYVHPGHQLDLWGDVLVAVIRDARVNARRPRPAAAERSSRCPRRERRPA
jgi:aminopeptidase N